MKKKTFMSITGLLFIFFLAAVFILNLILPDKSFSSDENRILQEKPNFSLSSYMEGRFETKMENYACDQFILRNQFIKVKISSDVTLGKIESNGVYKCKDNYLMEALNKPDKKKLNTTISKMTAFKRKYKKIKMYFMLVPNAANILSDKLPSLVKMNNQNKYIDDFYDRITDSGYGPIDVRDALSENSDNTQLYYRTDHHWTTDGAYIAYKKASEVMKLKNNVTYKPYIVKNDFRGTLASKSGFVNGQDDAIKIYLPNNDKDYNNSVIYYSDTKKKTTQFYQVENLATKDAYTVFGGSNHPIYTITTPTDSKEVLLLFKDSYANSFIPFIAQNYRKVIVIDPRYYYDDINDIIKSNDVSQVLFLYNANTFFSDDSLEMLLDN